MELIDLTELQKVLQDFAEDIRDRYRDVLAKNDHIASRKLVDSIKTQVEVGENYYEVTMTLEDYWKYVEFDTKPHFPPPDAILKWIEVKPVIPRPLGNGKLPTPKQLGFLITRAIVENGTQGSHDLEKVKDGVIPWYKEKIAIALGHDMENYIRKILVER